MTLKEYTSKLQSLLKEHPEWSDLPVMYAEDDEGNGYQKVYSEPTPAQVEDISQYNLEMVGFYDPSNDSVAKEDVNCICIN